MFYGLGTNFNYFNEHLRDVIMLAPCVYEETTYEELVAEFLPLKQAGEYYTGGDEDSEAAPYKSMQYTYQNFVEDQFKEPIPIEAYAAGQRDSPVIDLGDVGNTLPVTLIIGERDEVCTPKLAARIYDELSNADVRKRYEAHFDHGTFTWANGKFLGHLIAAIEDGGVRSQLVRPSGECFTGEAYNYYAEGETEYCNDVWRKWDEYCVEENYEPHACDQVEQEFEQTNDADALVLAKKALTMDKIKKSKGNVLLGAAQRSEQADDSVNSGAIIGASLAVFGAAAIYAIRRSMKKDDVFERQY